MPVKINIKNIPKGYQSFISNGRHAVLGDEPKDVKGSDLGFTPVEFLLSAKSMCKVATVRNVARRKGWEIGDVDAELDQVVKKGKDGSMSTTVTSSINIEGDITEEQRSLLIKEADNCYVTRMVKGDWYFEDSTSLN